MSIKIEYDINTKKAIFKQVEDIPKTDAELAQKRIDKIDAELEQIDSEGVTRHLENQIEASKTYDILYESTKQLIDRKNELREERKRLKEELAKC